MNLSRQDSTLSYLPQSHVYQRGVEIILTYLGVKIGYYSGEITRLVEDIQHLRPTVFFGVPRVYTRMLDRIMLGVKEKSHLTQWMFRKALAWKESSYRKDGRTVASSIPDFVSSIYTQRYLLVRSSSLFLLHLLFIHGPSLQSSKRVCSQRSLRRILRRPETVLSCTPPTRCLFEVR